MFGLGTILTGAFSTQHVTKASSVVIDVGLIAMPTSEKCSDTKPMFRIWTYLHMMNVSLYDKRLFFKLYLNSLLFKINLKGTFIDMPGAKDS